MLTYSQIHITVSESINRLQKVSVLKALKQVLQETKNYFR